LNSNRTSSFPAAIKTTTAAVLGSIGMTLLTLSLCIGAFSRGADGAGWILAGMTAGQVFLLSINITMKHHIDKKNSNAGP
jgi:hypothetical protein